MVRYLFLRNAAGNAVGTVAIDYERGAQFLRYAISRCSPVDTFNRSRGRQIAFGRLSKGLTLVFDEPLDTREDINAAVISSLETHYPNAGGAGLPKVAKATAAYLRRRGLK